MPLYPEGPRRDPAPAGQGDAAPAQPWVPSEDAFLERKKRLGRTPAAHEKHPEIKHASPGAARRHRT